ncbi:MAG: hypothetical protein AB1656_18780 [Candidatus Omnitrophota bacterium]
MKTFSSLSLLVIAYLPIAVYSQPLVLTPKDIDFTQITKINKDIGVIDTTEKSKLKIDLYKNQSAIDSSGNNIVSDRKLIKSIKSNTKSIDIPIEKTENLHDYNISGVWFDDVSLTLIYLYPSINLPGEGYATFNFYDIVNEKIIRTFTINQIPDLHFPQISSNGETIVIGKSYEYFDIYSRKEDGYISNTFGPYLNIYYHKPMIANNGNRLIFGIGYPETKNRWLYVDKVVDGWTMEKQIPDIAMNIDGEDFKFDIWAIANDGKTAIMKQQQFTIYNKTGKNHLLAIHEKDGIWSEPEYIGNFEFRPWPLDAVYIYSSDDGRVIAVRQAKRYNEIYEYTVSYDLYVFIKNSKGEWIKQKVNPEGVELEGTDAMQDILLSGDGSTLLWIPSKLYSGVDSKTYQ